MAKPDQEQWAEENQKLTTKAMPSLQDQNRLKQDPDLIVPAKAECYKSLKDIFDETRKIETAMKQRYKSAPAEPGKSNVVYLRFERKPS